MRVAKELRSLNAPALMGHLAETNSKIPIIRSGTSNPQVVHPPQEKVHPSTMEGRSPNPGMIRIPSLMSKHINSLTLEWPPQLIRKRVAELYKQLQDGNAHSPAFEQLDVDAHITGFFLQNYTSIFSSLSDIKKRRPDFSPKSILDISFGPATGLLAARGVFDIYNDDTANDASIRETAVIIGHPRMKRRAKELLGDGGRLLFRDDIPPVTSPKRFDLIIATHQLFQNGALSESLVDSHAQHLARLLSPNGIVLFVERGDPLGFEAVALAREHLLRPKYGFNVVGPCTHNFKCPLQVGLDVRQRAKNPGKENWCMFSQNVNRPKFSVELKKGRFLSQPWLPGLTHGAGGNALKGKGRPGSQNNESAKFSWVALENVKAPGEPRNWPRILKQPMKRHGHVTMEVCAPSGQIEHWTVPRSHGRQAYYDARKANASDLWALDAKVKQLRGGLRNPSKNLDPAISSRQKKREDGQKLSKAEWIGETSKDWWHPNSNPFFKFSSHQARVHSENSAPPEADGFIEVMESLIADEGRAEKVLRRDVQKKYRK